MRTYPLCRQSNTYFVLLVSNSAGILTALDKVETHTGAPEDLILDGVEWTGAVVAVGVPIEWNRADEWNEVLLILAGHLSGARFRAEHAWCGCGCWVSGGCFLGGGWFDVS